MARGEGYGSGTAPEHSYRYSRIKKTTAAKLARVTVIPNWLNNQQGNVGIVVA
jgi:hypothetical protein